MNLPKGLIHTSDLLGKFFCSFKKNIADIYLEKCANTTNFEFIFFTGSLFSLIYFARLLAILVGSVLFNQLYAATIAWYRGFCFTFAAGLLVIPVAGFM